MNLKRRSFLSVIAAALGASAVTKTAQAQLYTPVPEKWNETVDVLVIGRRCRFRSRSYSKRRRC